MGRKKDVKGVVAANDIDGIVSSIIEQMELVRSASQLTALTKSIIAKQGKDIELFKVLQLVASKLKVKTKALTVEGLSKAIFNNK